MSNQFRDKTIVITGGTSGIGKALALSIASESANIVIAGRNTKSGRQVEDQINKEESTSKFIQTDVTSEQQVQHLFAETHDTFGSIDYLFNNAGEEGPMVPVTEFSEEVFDKVSDVNFKGAFFCVKHVLPYMLEQNNGVIVNTSSFVGTTLPFPAGMVYGATKAAIMSMTATLAEAYKEHNIRILAVSPWMVDTPMLERLTGGNDEIRNQFQQINPSGEFVKAEEIASVVTEMFAGENGYETGQAFLVDAGAKTQQVQIPFETIE